MKFRLTCLAICLGLGLGTVACKNNDVTGTGGALASLTVDAPDSAHSGVPFDIAVRALAVGVTNVHNGHVEVTLPAPLTVSAVDDSAGTTASFTNNTAGGAQVSWDLGTLDSNTQSTLHITAAGALAAGAAPQTLTVRATLTADGIRAGEAVADDNVQLLP